MKVPSRKKTERTKQVFLRKVIGPFLVILFILAGFLFSVSNQDPYTRTRAQESETEMVESVKSENTIATEGETEELTEESISEDIPLDDQSQTDSADLKEPTEAAELEVAVEGEGDDLQKIVEEESIINEEELFDCVEIEIPAEPVEAEEEIIEAAAAVAEEVSYEEEIVEEVIDRPIEEESAAVDEDVAEGTAEEEIEGPAEERPVKEKVADEGEGDEEALIEEVTEVPVEEEVTEVAEEVIEEEIVEEEIVEEEIVEYEEVEILREGKLFRCKRKMPATESAVVAEEQEEEVAEIIQDVEEKKAILEGVLIKEGDNFAEENEVSKIKLAEVEIEGKILGDEVSLNEAVEALVGLTTTEQDIEKAVIRSVLRQKDNNIAAAVLQDKKTEGLIRQNAKKALLETLENKVGKTIGRKTVQELIATDLKDDPEIKDVINLMVTDDLKMELIRRTVKNNLQEEGIELEDDVKELIKNDYNKFVLEELMGEKLKKKESTQAILVDAVGAEEEVAEEKPIIPVIKVMARGPAGTIQIPIENLRFEAGSVVMIVDPIRQFAPGVYQIEVEINNPITGRTETILQDFAWGVLAINTGKDIYQPGDLAAINIGVLDDQGWPVCDAEVVLEIKSPSDSIGYPKVENTGNCEIFNSLNTKPDYRAEYTFSQEGKYVLKLSATLPNGKTRTMTSSVKVVRIPDFVIYRSAATRLYPVGISPMSIDVYFYRDFEGYISDVVPGDFQINSMESTGSAVSTNGEINTTDGSDVKLITWQVKAKSGNVQSFRYFYDAPDISPQFYTIGPLNSSGTLYEKRKWQIANDEPRIAADTEGDLLGHWKFNTGSGSTAIDSSTYGNDGTLTNMEAGDWSTDTPTGMNDDPYSLDFDGSNEYVTVSDPVGGELDFTYEDDFSITGWFNRADDGVYRTILAKRNGTSTSDVGYVVSILAETDELLFEVSDGDDRYEMRSSTTFTSASGWNHFAIVWDQDSAANSKIYINGTDDSETHSGTIDDIGDLANSLAVNIAAESDAEAPFYGKLDDIRIYDRVLTADEVSVLAGGNAPGGISSDLQLWLRADAGVTTSGSDVTDWADQSGNGNDASQATTTNQPDLLTDNLNYNPVIDFDGVDNFMSISGGLFGTATHSELNVYEVKRINTVKQSYSFTEWVSTGLVSAHMPWSDNNIYWDGGGTSGNYRLSAAWGGTVTEPYIWSMSYSTSGATPDGNNQDISRNGLSIGNDATATSFTGTGSDFYLNSNAYGSAYFEDSSRAEFIVYTGSITATENQKIESYLAIKYGITIDQSDASGGIDYIDSSGTTVWAQDTSDTFENDISGIGQDDTSSLNQTQSKSSDSDGILRVADATAMDDLDFFTWSNNNGTASWTMTGAPAGYEILSRQWRSYVYLATKDVETVDFEFDVADTDFNVPAPVSGTTYYFVYDKDKDGNLDDECLSTGSCATTGGVIAMNDSGSSGDDTADDNKWTAQADFPEEAATYTQIKFTLATEFPYPGGVNSNLEMWLRADSNSVSQSGNGTAATDWTDLSSNAYLFDRTISGIGGSDPTWYSSLINGNPAVSFSATTDRLGISSFSGMPTGDLWIATVYQDEDSNDEWIWTYGANDCSVRLEADGSFATYYGDNPLYSSAANGDDGKPHILTMRRTGTTFTQVLDNLQIGTESNSDTPAASQCIMLGERMSTNCVAYGTSSDFEGDIAEIIAYDNYPSVTDQKKINSYLAIKYGIPLDQTTPTDYLDSDGNTIWDSSETTYNHDIVGIGQDDDSGLDQTSTKYEDTENILQISEADSQDDLDFLTWAHNDGDRLWTSTDAPAGYQILERQWQFQETGDIGGFDIEFDVRDVHWMVPALLSGSSFYLVYDSDDDGSLSDETPVAMYDDGSTSGDDDSGDNQWTYRISEANVPTATVQNGVLFTLATPTGTQTYPVGDLSTDLHLWLRADSSSVSQSGNGTSATGWTDLSPYAFYFDRTTSGIGGADPTWYSSRIGNYPAISFSATTDRLGIADFYDLPVGDFWMTTVYQREDSNDEWIWSYGAYETMSRLREDGSFIGYYGGGSQYSSAADGDDENPHIYTLRRTGTTFTQVLDNLQIGTGSNSYTSTTGQCLVLGERTSTSCVAYGTGYDFEGDIAEILIYDSYPSATDQKRLNSYLALKYGVPLDQTTPTDYLASDSTVIWDSSETTYNHDIMGIGQDDDSGLDQTSMKYTDDENILQISEATLQSDGDFLIWAHNDGDRLWTSTDAPAGYQILERQWQFQETGDIGGFDIEFDVRDVHCMVPALLSGSSFYLVYDSDDDGSLSDETPVAMYDDGSTSGDDDSGDNQWTYRISEANVPTATVQNGVLFTLATPDGTQFYPANNSTDLHLWLRADSSSVSQSGNGTSATDWTSVDPYAFYFDRTISNIAGSDPTWYSSRINSNPAISFSATDDRLGIADFYDLPVGDFWMTTVYQREDSNDEWIWSYGAYETMSRLREDGSFIGYYGGGSQYSSAADGDDENPHIYTLRRTGTTFTQVLDNLQIGTGSNSYTSTTGQCLVLGERTSTSCVAYSTDYDFEGDIAEMIFYQSYPSASDQQEINSYLALKYGITLDQGVAPLDYLASDGTTEMWDASEAGSYNNDIAGIGRDDASGLNQTSSRSVNLDSILTISAASDLDNLEFFTWGNDNGSVDTRSTELPAAGLPDNAEYRLTREWLVQNDDGDGVGTVTVKFDLDRQDALGNTQSAGDYALLIDSDGDFSADTTIWTTGATFDGNQIYFTGATIADGSYITLAGPIAASPGGVISNLAIWLNSNMELYTDTSCNSVASNGNDVKCWKDQSANNFDVSHSTFPPSLNNVCAAANFNYNSFLNFNDGKRLSNTINTVLASDDNATIFAVASSDSLTGSDAVVAFDTGNPQMGTNGTDLELYDDTSYTGGFTLATGNTYLMDWSWTQGADATVGLNGKRVNKGSGHVSGIASGFHVGNDAGYIDDWIGDIAEIAVYNTELSATDIQKVHSYMALKYGITIDQTTPTDYLASDGTTEMWNKDATGASTYNNDIAGIGKDTDANLNQIQSRSINADSVISVSNASDLDNLEFFSWGNDNGSTSIISSEVPGSLPGDANARLTREWLVQNDDGDGVGSVTITFDLYGQSALKNTGVAGDYALLIDADGDFSNATVYTTGAAFSGNEVSFTGATIADGSYITLAGPQQPAPGGVTINLQLWLKADGNVYQGPGATNPATTTGQSVEYWADESGNGRYVDQTTSGNQPSYTDDSMNNNPVLTFAGGTNTSTHDFFVRTALDLDDIMNNDAYHVFSVFDADSIDYTGGTSYAGDSMIGDTGGYFGIYFASSGGSIIKQYNWDGSEDVTANSISLNQPYVYQMSHGSGSLSSSVNGGTEQTAASGNTSDVTYDFRVGRGYSGYAFDGDIAEVISYDAELSAANQSKVESYLALKYGITLDQSTAQDYVASDGTEMWNKDATGASTYNNDIAGIGKDVASDITQTQSRSINSDSILTISNASDLDNLEFLSWGNDDGSVADSSSQVPEGLPGDASIRLTREWLIQNDDGDGVGTVTVAFDLDSQSALDNTGTAGDYALLIDADGDFSNATVYTTGAAFSGNEIYFTGATIADGSYISLAGPVPPVPAAPGGVVTNLAMWLDANTGLYTNTGCSSAASNGNTIGCWTDRSTGGFNVTAETKQPVVDSLQTANTFNYNSFLTFTSDDLVNTGTLLASDSHAIVFAIARNTQLSGWNSIITFGIDNPQLGTNGTDINLYDVSSLNGGFTLSTNTTYLMDWSWTQGTNGTVGINASRTTSGSNIVSGIAAGFGIGGDNGSNEYWVGDIAEMAVYNAEPGDTNIQKVHSYLALKYGITLYQGAGSGGTAYLDSAGSTIWAVDTSDVYENDIAGIGQDDASGLDQTQSKSVNSDSILRVADAASQDNLDFLFWSNSNGGATWTATGAPTGYKLLTRQWQAQESNDIGTADLEFDVADAEFDVPALESGTAYYFVYDADNDADLSDECLSGGGCATPGGIITMKDDGTAGDDTGSDNKWTGRINFVNTGDGKIDFTIATQSSVSQPTVTDANISIAGSTGTSGAYIVGDTITVTWDNSATGDNNSGLTSVTANLSGWGGSGTAVMTDTTACLGTESDNIYEACYTLVSGSIDTTNVNASVTATNAGGPTTTADTTNATVDNQPPIVTASAISVTGATGGSGEFIYGDTAAGRWDNSATGDNNSDTLAATTPVVFNLSDWVSGQTAVEGSNAANIWTTIALDPIDSQNTTNNNVTVTVTDNAGNITTTAGTNNYTINSLPTVDTVVITGSAPEDDLDLTYNLTPVSAKAVVDWKKDQSSIAVLNMPFEANGGSESTTTADYSGNSITGSISGATWGGTSGVDGGGAYSFDGSNYINLGTPASLDFDNTTNVTFSMWLKTSDTTAERRIYWKRAGTKGLDMLMSDSVGGNIQMFYGDGSSYVYATNIINTNIADGDWHHIAIVIDHSASQIRGYLDGSYENNPLNISGVTGDISGAGIAYLGGSPALDFNGTIDEVQIYDSALTAEQIAHLYNSGTPDYDTIDHLETTSGEDWQACVTPNDGVLDGAEVCSDEITIKPLVTDANIAINTGDATGTGGAYIVGDTITVTWDNSATGDNNSGLTGLTADLSGWGGSGTAVMTDTTACLGTASDNIWEACYTLVSGSIDATNVNASVTATNTGGQTTTADTSNATVDNQPPNITDNGTLTVTVDNGVADVAAVNNGFDNQDKVTQSAVTLAVSDGDTSSINLTALTGEASLSLGTQSSVITPGALDNASQTFTITVTDNAGNVTTTDSDAISVDNELATVSTSAISVTGASGGSEEFIYGDTATGQWDDSATGDNNSDTISTVSFDLSDWVSGQTAVGGSNTADVWTTTALDPIDSQNTTNNNVTVTVTDNAGNITTTAGTNNYSIDSRATVDTVVITGSAPEDDLDLSYNLTPGSAKAVVDWKKNASSIAVLNIPFEANGGSEDTTTYDYSDSGNDGTLAGGVTWSSTGGVDGGGAYSFDGTSGTYIEITDDDSLDFNSTSEHFTIMAWAKHTCPTCEDRDVIISKGDVGNCQANYALNFNYSNGHMEFSINDGSSCAGLDQLVGSTEWQNNTWYHVAAVYDGTNLKLYLNGASDGSKVAAKVPHATTTPLRIGWGYSSFLWNGLIDEVQIYDSALTPEQITAIYNSGTPDYDTIVAEETLANDDWQACVTPNDGVLDGAEVCSDEITIKPLVTDANISIAGASGTGGAYIIGDTITVTWDNSATGDNNSGLTGLTANLSGWGGSSTAAMTDTTACSGTASDNIYEACYTLVSGAIDTTNVNASVTATNAGGQTTTADTSNTTVDNDPPTDTSITPGSTRIIDNSNPSFTVYDGTDIDIDTGSRDLERQEAAYSGNACGSYGSFSSVAYSGTYPNISDGTVTGSKCYKYRWSVDDDAGNNTTSSETSVIIRVPMTTITITGGNNQSYGGGANNPIGYTLPTALQVQVTDGGTNWALADEITVDFAITSVPATPTATGQNLSETEINTDASGNAETSLTFGDRAGVYQVQATSTHSSITVEPTFSETAGNYTNLVITEDNLSIDLDPSGTASDSASPTVTVTTNAASYDVQLTPNRWPLSSLLDEILNWAASLGFGWNLNLGAVTAYTENLGDPAATTVYSCSGDTCQGANEINIDIHAGIDYSYAAGAYTNTIEFSTANESY